ncbi:MAG TPA: hypothetical protein VFU02_23835 [Polyangiaceae bacterium]|nr:hypothetical protein [Polyangiaceae bacterium]
MAKSARWLPWCVLGLPLGWACSDGPVTVAQLEGSTGTASSAGGAGGSAGGSGGESAAGAAGAPATGGTNGTSTAGGSGGSTTAPPGLGVGDDCSEDACRMGLVCDDEVCALAGTTEEGQPCVASGECAEDLVCAGQVCSPAGSGEVGSSCESDLDCEAGLRCGLVGLEAECLPEGTLDLGDACDVSSDCLGGLACLEGSCTPPLPGMPPFGLPSWQGVECEDPSPDGVRAYFEVPGAEDALEGDFFRLPFPNDVRLTGGSPDLGDFPTPGDELLGVDPVQLYIDRIESEHTGWGTEPKVLFRFSGEIDHTSFVSDAAKTEGRVRIVDVTPGIADAERDDTGGWMVYYTSGRSNYVCHNWFGLSRGLGAPMRAGHTYAFLLTTGGRDAEGRSIERAENLVALLGDEPPSDPILADAYAAYEPLRDYLATDDGNDSGRLDLDADDVLNATVISVADHQETMRELANAVRSAGAPVAHDWVRCEAGAESPCPDAEGSRACGSGTSSYDEYHALVDLPIFQQGTAPYLTEGGGIDTSAPIRTEPVCLSLTVPLGTAPSNGWPLVVFAHGTGGNFRSHVNDEVAGVLSESSDAHPVPFAVLGIDQVEHGPRRGDSNDSPDDLFFNFLNPDAARGNPLQGATDQLSLFELAQVLTIPGAATGGDPVEINGNRVVFFGHSQGATQGSLMLPYASFPGAVLSGNGAGIRYSLLTKTAPVDIARSLPIVLWDPATDGSLEMGEWHPALGLIQQWSDAADPYNFAEIAALRPEPDQTPHHIFQTYGIDDSYSPPLTLFAYALAAGLENAPLPAGVDPDADNQNDRLPPEAEPLSGNRTIQGEGYTLALRQYEPASNSDGHFVAFDVAEANQDVVEFLFALGERETPSVGQ